MINPPVPGKTSPGATPQTTAVVPYSPRFPRVSHEDHSVIRGTANRYDVQMAKMAYRDADKARAWSLVNTVADKAMDLAKNPVAVTIIGFAAINQLSRNDRYLTGAQAVMLQSALITPTFLQALSEIAKAGGDIAGLLKLVGMFAA